MQNSVLRWLFGFLFFGKCLAILYILKFRLIFWSSKLLEISSADEELFFEMAIQDIKIGIDIFLQPLGPCNIGNGKLGPQTGLTTPFNNSVECTFTSRDMFVKGLQVLSVSSFCVCTCGFSGLLVLSNFAIFSALICFIFQTFGD